MLLFSLSNIYSITLKTEDWKRTLTAPYISPTPHGISPSLPSPAR